jgi:uncharacterized protein (TIGR02118 family)
MIKFSVLYPNTPGVRFDMDYYLQKHMPMAIGFLSTHPGYQGVSVERGVSGEGPGTDASYIAMCHFLFDKPESFMEAFGPHVAELQADIPVYTDAVPVVQMSEVLLANPGPTQADPAVTGR